MTRERERSIVGISTLKTKLREISNSVLKIKLSDISQCISPIVSVGIQVIPSAFTVYTVSFKVTQNSNDLHSAETDYFLPEGQGNKIWSMIFNFMLIKYFINKYKRIKVCDKIDLTLFIFLPTLANKYHDKHGALTLWNSIYITLIFLFNTIKKTVNFRSKKYV